MSSPRPTPAAADSDAHVLAANTAVRLDQRLFLLFIAALPLMQPLGLWLKQSYVYIADAAAVLCMLSLVVAVLRRRTSIRHTWFYGVAAAYLFFVSLSAAFSADPRLSATRMLVDVYVLLLAALSLQYARPEFLPKIANAWMIGTGITVAAGLAGIVLFYLGQPGADFFLGGYGSLPPGRYPRVTGLFLNFNMCCNYLSVSLLLALAMLDLGWLRRPMFRALLVALPLVAAFTVSPGLGGLLLGAGWWTWMRYRDGANRRLGATALLLGIGAAAAFFVAMMISPAQQGRSGLREFTLHAPLEPSSRLLCWEAAIAEIRAHPLFGLGAGLPVDCPAYLDASGSVQLQTDAHNIFLNVAAHEGLAALAALLGIFAWTLWPLRPQRRITAAPAVFRVALTIAVAQAFLYQGLGGSFEHTRHLWVTLGLLAGLKIED